ncbi:hypothetical protein SAMN05421505_12013 [Sinosporangium album]|uniref:Uncharacterized protein n=1 Tax=Sinosporangium album TaxID=504805 RepID=A0A1G8EAK0_9ACTN|nr:hypothetical protein [Sinosporangium album]SDH66935.1 hypothetical protein SAMN05421505_12013 [Sinosporangium album]
MSTQPDEPVYTVISAADAIEAISLEQMRMNNRIQAKLHNHPLVAEIRQRRHDAILPHGASRDAVEQTITMEQARDLEAFLNLLRGLYPTALVPKLGPLTPGTHLFTLYGVRVKLEPLPPVVAEQRGGNGVVGMLEICAPLLPPGTCPGPAAYRLVSSELDDQAVAEMKQDLARELREPHIVLDLGADDLPPWIHPDPRYTGPGWRFIVGVTVKAVPGRTEFVVLRPVPGSRPIGSLDGEWMRRPSIPVHAVLINDHVARVIGAEPTGHIEVNDAGQIAEVYEVSA